MAIFTLNILYFIIFHPLDFSTNISLVFFSILTAFIKFHPDIGQSHVVGICMSPSTVIIILYENTNIHTEREIGKVQAGKCHLEKQKSCPLFRKEEIEKEGKYKKKVSKEEINSETSGRKNECKQGIERASGYTTYT